MANIKSAKKRTRQAIKRRKINLARRSALKTAEKKVIESLNRGEDIAVVRSLLRDAESKIARAKGKGLLHPNTAARKVSRLSKKVAAVVSE